MNPKQCLKNKIKISFRSFSSTLQRAQVCLREGVPHRLALSPLAEAGFVGGARTGYSRLIDVKEEKEDEIE